MMQNKTAALVISGPISLEQFQNLFLRVSSDKQDLLTLLTNLWQRQLQYHIAPGFVIDDAFQMWHFMFPSLFRQCFAEHPQKIELLKAYARNMYELSVSLYHESPHWRYKNNLPSIVKGQQAQLHFASGISIAADHMLEDANKLGIRIFDPETEPWVSEEIARIKALCHTVRQRILSVDVQQLNAAMDAYTGSLRGYRDRQESLPSGKDMPEDQCVFAILDWSEPELRDFYRAISQVISSKGLLPRSPRDRELERTGHIVRQFLLRSEFILGSDVGDGT